MKELPAELYSHDFAQLARKEKDARIRIRLLGLAHLREGKSYTEVAQILKVHVISPRRWVQRLSEGGLPNLHEKSGRGRKRILSKAAEVQLIEGVETLQACRSGGVLIARDIQVFLKEQLGADYALSSVYTVLHRAKLSWITGRSQSPHANVEEQEAFKKTFEKRLKRACRKRYL
jgi:transposase